MIFLKLTIFFAGIGAVLCWGKEIFGNNKTGQTIWLIGMWALMIAIVVGLQFLTIAIYNKQVHGINELEKL